MNMIGIEIFYSLIEIIHLSRSKIDCYHYVGTGKNYLFDEIIRY